LRWREVADRAASLGLSAREHRRLADVLLLAARRRRPVAPLTARYPELTLADAACIRDAVVARRVEQGDPLVGARASFEATPHLSWLTESALVQDEVLDATPLIAPRVRQVIVFRVGRALSRPEALLTSIAAVHHGLEILDSRYNGGAVSEIDDLADNYSAAGLYVGPRASTDTTVDLPGPIAWLARQLTDDGRSVPYNALLVTPVGVPPVPLDRRRPFQEMALLPSHAGAGADPPSPGGE
jgi:2-keto-4-pentenoate hydratase